MVDLDKLLDENVTELDLSGIRLGDEGVKNIVSPLARPTCNVTHLKLGHCDIGVQGIKEVAALISSRHSKITHLDLRHNRLGDMGAKIIGDVLPYSGIVNLDLSCNGITHIGIGNLMPGLQHGLVTDLNLQDNVFFQQGVHELHNGLPLTNVHNISVEAHPAFVRTPQSYELVSPSSIAALNTICYANRMRERGTRLPMPPSPHISIAENTRGDRKSGFAELINAMRKNEIDSGYGK